MKEYIYLMFIGDNFVNFATPTKRFVIRVLKSDYDNDDLGTMVGLVIARNKNAMRELGEGGTTWANPVSDIKQGRMPALVPIGRHDIAAGFSEVSTNY